MNAFEVVQQLLSAKLNNTPRAQGQAFAPVNIALCKYWGKRNATLNLPVTSSLSIALPDKGATTTLTRSTTDEDRVILNGEPLTPTTEFVKRLAQYLDLFRAHHTWRLQVDIQMNIPVAAGFASSAAGFASLVLALNDLFDWQCSKETLSILARLGSGSAARSLWSGFVEWQTGVDENGMDSYGQPLPYPWPELRVGLLTVSEKEKPLSSRKAMQQTVETSLLYQAWPKQVERDLALLKKAIQKKDFLSLGQTAENNALAMHATMLSSQPPICYFLPETIATMHHIWKARAQGLSLFFTEDAGPNLKLLFVENDRVQVQALFPSVVISEV